MKLIILLLLFILIGCYSAISMKNELIQEDDAINLAKQFLAKQDFKNDYNLDSAKILYITGADEYVFVQIYPIFIPANALNFLTIRIHKKTKKISYTKYLGDPFTE